MQGTTMKKTKSCCCISNINPLKTY